jgi:hypothetical protein
MLTQLTTSEWSTENGRPPVAVNIWLSTHEIRLTSHTKKSRTSQVEGKKTKNVNLATGCICYRLISLTAGRYNYVFSHHELTEFDLGQTSRLDPQFHVFIQSPLVFCLLLRPFSWFPPDVCVDLGLAPSLISRQEDRFPNHRQANLVPNFQSQPPLIFTRPFFPATLPLWSTTVSL